MTAKRVPREVVCPVHNRIASIARVSSMHPMELSCGDGQHELTEAQQTEMMASWPTVPDPMADLRAEVQKMRDTVHDLEPGGPGGGAIGDPTFAQCQAFTAVLKRIDQYAPDPRPTPGPLAYPHEGDQE